MGEDITSAKHPRKTPAQNQGAEHPRRTKAQNTRAKLRLARHWRIDGFTTGPDLMADQ
jgi:hypothetical protein